MKKKKHGHYCRICGDYKPNEKFSGKGHARHICKACTKLSVDQRNELQRENRITEDDLNFIADFERFPSCPVHPGKLLKDELEYRHLSQEVVAKQLGLSYTEFNEILNGKSPVTTDFALIMEAALGVPAYILAGMQTDYNLQMAQKDSELNQRLAEIRKIAVELNKGTSNNSISPF